MKVQLRKPGCQVLLKKNVKRQNVAGTTPMSTRYSGQNTVVDLTKYLGEGSVIRTRKSVREDAGGFSVTFCDEIDPETADTFYASIEPQDSIEIYFAANSYQYAGNPLPLIMRGIVSSVERTQGMSADGKPTMSVTVAGQDYGKILGMYQVFFMPFGQDAFNMCTSFPFFAKFGANANVTSANSFVQQVVQNIVNPFISAMAQLDPLVQVPPTPQQRLAALNAQMSGISDQIAAVTAEAQTAGAASTQYSFSANGSTPGANGLTLALGLQRSNAQQYTTQLQALGQQQAAVQTKINALQAQIKANANQAIGPIMPIGTDIQVGDEVMSIQAGAWTGGTLMSLFKQFCDIGPWNEMFIEDRVDAPYLVYRPMPFLSASTQQPIIPANYTGSVVPPTVGSSTAPLNAPTPANSPNATNGAAPVTTTISRNDVVSLTSRRSDEGVANYYWVDAPRFNLNYNDTVQQFAIASAVNNQDPFLASDPNCDPNLYGVRKMEVATNMGGPTETNSGNGTYAGQQRIDNQQGFTDWINLRRQQLHDLNVDNVVFESGSIHAKGNENIRAGTYVDIADDAGDLPSQYYAYEVEHIYEVFGSFFSSIAYDRGTGFIDRVTNNQANASPYLSEQYIKPFSSSATS
jgi:hypothetical protein